MPLTMANPGECYTIRKVGGKEDDLDGGDENPYKRPEDFLKILASSLAET